MVNLPDSFFTKVLPQVQNIAELRAILYVFYLLSSKQSITYQELLSYQELMAGIGERGLCHVLDLAVENGVLLSSTLNIAEGGQRAYSIKTAQSIFVLYEQNVGIITPFIAEELKEAERRYPAEWIKQAFKEAVVMNKRNWKYIARILERWASEGKESGAYKRDSKKSSPNKYITGKYGHLVKR